MNTAANSTRLGYGLGSLTLALCPPGSMSIDRSAFITRMTEGMKKWSYPCGCVIEDRPRDRSSHIRVCTDHSHSAQQMMDALLRPHGYSQATIRL